MAKLFRRKLAGVRFKNKAAIECHQIEGGGFPKGDAVLLTFRRKRKQTVMAMQPDEAMAVIRVLSKGLHELITDYSWYSLKGRRR